MADDQLPLGALNPTPAARRTDPPTSHQAAASVKGLTKKQRAVLHLLSRIGPCTDRKLVAEYQRRYQVPVPQRPYPGQTDSGIRTRRHELADKGLVRQHSEERLESGRMAATWRCVFEPLGA